MNSEGVAMNMKKTICIILVVSIVLGFLGMIGAWLATL